MFDGNMQKQPTFVNKIKKLSAVPSSFGINGGLNFFLCPIQGNNVVGQCLTQSYEEIEWIT